MKFKVGDKVRVVRRITSNDKGNNCGWNMAGLMDNTIGMQGTIISGYERIGTVRVEFKDGESWIYLEDCLELINSLPINITFKDKYEHQAMQQFLFDNGCSWSYMNQKKVEEYGNNTIRVDTWRDMSQLLGNEIPVDYAKDPTFTFADRDIIKEILNSSKPITKLELNTEYTAEIDPNTETVKVGCQTFTFAKIKELASKLN